MGTEKDYLQACCGHSPSCEALGGISRGGETKQRNSPKRKPSLERNRHLLRPNPLQKPWSKTIYQGAAKPRCFLPNEDQKKRLLWGVFFLKNNNYCYPFYFMETKPDVTLRGVFAECFAFCEQAIQFYFKSGFLKILKSFSFVRSERRKGRASPRGKTLRLKMACAVAFKHKLPTCVCLVQRSAWLAKPRLVITDHNSVLYICVTV